MPAAKILPIGRDRTAGFNESLFENIAFALGIRTFRQMEFSAYVGSINVFSKISRLQFGHFAGCSMT